MVIPVKHVLSYEHGSIIIVINETYIRKLQMELLDRTCARLKIDQCSLMLHSCEAPAIRQFQETVIWRYAGYI